MTARTVEFQVEYEEVAEATRELAEWRSGADQLPAHLRDRIKALNTQVGGHIRIVVDGPVIRAELTADFRALLASLRAYRRGRG